MSQTNSSYQIYALIDPRDNAVRYVGLSTDAHVRFYGHLNSTNDNEQKKRWIVELRRQGLSPILQVIETVDASVDAQSIAHEREYHWIQEMLRLGHPLLNVRGNKHAYIRVSVPEYQKKRKPVFKISSTKGWLSVEDIAKELGVHVDTVRGWIRDRKLRATKLGRDYRIRRVDLGLVKKQLSELSRSLTAQADLALSGERFGNQAIEEEANWLNSCWRGTCFRKLSRIA